MLSANTLKHCAAAALAAAFAFAAAPPAAAQASLLERYSNWQSFDARRTQLLATNYRLADVEFCRAPSGGASWWVAVYHNHAGVQIPAGADRIVRSNSWNAFSAQADSLLQQGLVLDDMDAYVTQGERFVGVFNQRPGAQRILRAQGWAVFYATSVAYQGEGLRLYDIDLVTVNGQPQYYGVMRASTEHEHAAHNTTWASFQTQWTILIGGGWRLRDFAIVQGHFVGVYNQGSGDSAIDSYDSWAALLQRQTTIGALRLEDVECWSEGQTLRYAASWRAPPRRQPRPVEGLPDPTVRR
jgi:hypothetical protein